MREVEIHIWKKERDTVGRRKGDIREKEPDTFGRRRWIQS